VGGIIVDPNKVPTMLVGAKAPMLLAVLDVCLDCGTVYAVRLERGGGNFNRFHPTGPKAIGWGDTTRWREGLSWLRLTLSY